MMPELTQDAPTDQEMLDTAARLTSLLHLRTMRMIGAPRKDSEALCLAKEQDARCAAKLAEQVGELLDSLGAKKPVGVPQFEEVPLDKLDTPATRALLDALEVAALASRAVDEERGWVDGDGKPCGFYERFSAEHLLLRREIFGAAGEGRE
jgi:hypothetical protein